VEWADGAFGAGSSNSYESERGLFIDETRRTHPDVCRFISAAIYEDRSCEASFVIL
jgi:hypothetical protein